MDTMGEYRFEFVRVGEREDKGGVQGPLLMKQKKGKIYELKEIAGFFFKKNLLSSFCEAQKKKTR